MARDVILDFPGIVECCIWILDVTKKWNIVRRDGTASRKKTRISLATCFQQQATVESVILLVIATTIVPVHPKVSFHRDDDDDQFEDGIDIYNTAENRRFTRPHRRWATGATAPAGGSPCPSVFIMHTSHLD